MIQDNYKKDLKLDEGIYNRFVIQDGEHQESYIPNGHGSIIWNDGTKYIGEFFAGKCNGFGTLTQTNG